MRDARYKRLQLINLPIKLVVSEDNLAWSVQRIGY